MADTTFMPASPRPIKLPLVLRMLVTRDRPHWNLREVEASGSSPIESYLRHQPLPNLH